MIFQPNSFWYTVKISENLRFWCHWKMKAGKHSPCIIIKKNKIFYNNNKNKKLINYFATVNLSFYVLILIQSSWVQEWLQKKKWKFSLEKYVQAIKLVESGRKIQKGCGRVWCRSDTNTRNFRMRTWVLGQFVVYNRQQIKR